MYLTTARYSYCCTVLTSKWKVYLFLLPSINHVFLLDTKTQTFSNAVEDQRAYPTWYSGSMLAAKVQLYYGNCHGRRQRQEEDGRAEKLT